MYQVNGVCYSSPSAALAAMAADMYGSGVSDSGQPYTFYTTASGSALVTHSSVGFESSIIPELQNCQLITPEQSSIYSLGVLGVWAAVWAVVVLRRGLHDHS